MIEVLKHVFFHNPHDRQSGEKLRELQCLDVQIDEVVDVTDVSARDRFASYRLRAAPSYAVFEIHEGQPAILFSAEESGIDPALLDTMIFESLETGPRLAPEQQEIEALRAALAEKDALIQEIRKRLDDLELVAMDTASRPQRA